MVTTALYHHRRRAVIVFLNHYYPKSWLSRPYSTQQQQQQQWFSLSSYTTTIRYNNSNHHPLTRNLPYHRLFYHQQQQQQQQQQQRHRHRHRLRVYTRRRCCDEWLSSYYGTTISTTIAPYYLFKLHRRSVSSSSKPSTSSTNTDSFYDDPNNNTTTIQLQPAQFHSGPSLQLGIGKCALHTYASIIGTAGSTTILCTVARDAFDITTTTTNNNTGITDDDSFLTVEFRQRSSAVGQIPQNRLRNDYGRAMTSSEVLAARIIDRSLRPLLKKNENQDCTTVANTNKSGTASTTVTISGQGTSTVVTGAAPAHYHIVTAVQAIDVWGASGHPIATALNAASAALYTQLTEPVAATVLAVMSDGSIVQDPNPTIRQPIQTITTTATATTTTTPSSTISDTARNSTKASFKNSSSSTTKDGGDRGDAEEDGIQIEPYCVGELFFAGTRTHVVMMEWTSIHDSLSEDQWSILLDVAHGTIQPILDTIIEYHAIQQQHQSSTQLVDQPDGVLSEQDKLEITTQLRASLGLPPLPVNFDEMDDAAARTSESEEEDDDDDDDTDDEDEEDMEKDDVRAAMTLNRKELFNRTLLYCYDQMSMKPIYTLYGVRSTALPPKKDTSLLDNVVTHRNPDEILSKRHRGRRETIMNQEIYRLVDEYLTDEAGLVLTSTNSNHNSHHNDKDGSSGSDS
jgi:hypothetical protein